MKSIVYVSLLAIGMSLMANCASAEDWPGFLGPKGNAVSMEGPIQTDFEGISPKILWRKKLGEGYAAAAVLGDELFVLDREDSLKDIMLCLDLKSGQQKWSCPYEAPGKFSFNGSRTTAAVDSNSVYSVGPMGEMTCFDRKTHKIRWQKNMVTEFDSKRPRWAVSQSPLLVDDKVIIAPQGSKASVVALDKTDGKLIWKLDSMPGGMNYCSPTLMEICGVKQIVAICGNRSSTIVSVNPDNGQILWKFDKWSCGAPIPGPTLMSGDRIFATGGYDADSVIIQISRTDGIFKVEESQRIKATGSQIANPLIFDGMIYVNCNTNKTKTGLACFNETGEMMWNTGKVGPAGFDRGNMMAVDDKLLILDEGGNLRIVQPDPYRYEELACIKLFDSGKQAWSPMAFSQGMLLIRNQTEMICVVMDAAAYK